MNPIAQQIETLLIGPAQRFNNLVVFPLLSPEPSAQSYLTLDEALDQRLVSITELTQGGVVPELRLENLSDRQVLLLDGEELVGAKQNRVLNITILVAGFAKLVIPVSCVERGRWHRLSREFGSAKRHMYAKARAAKMEQVTTSMRSHGMRRSDQSAVWSEIDAKSQRLGSHSATEAMADIFEQERSRLAGFAQAFQPLEKQVGAVFAINGRIIGAELFDSAIVFRKLLSKLVGSYALDAIEEPDDQAEGLAAKEAKTLLDRIKSSAFEAFPAVGEGEDVRFQGSEVSGGALIADGRVVHLSAFASNS